MRLIELSPRWFDLNGQRAGFVFKCPHCPTSTTWLSCKFVFMDVGRGQYELFRKLFPDLDVSEIVPTKREACWVMSGSGFEEPDRRPIDQRRGVGSLAWTHHQGRDRVINLEVLSRSLLHGGGALPGFLDVVPYLGAAGVLIVLVAVLAAIWKGRR